MSVKANKKAGTLQCGLQAGRNGFIVPRMPEIQPKQFRLTDEGVILFQPDPTNPLPGNQVGRIKKGAELLRPEAEVSDAAMDAAKVSDWLQARIHEVLQPLMLLKDEEQISAPAREITLKLYEALGILPRADLEASIAALDEEGRRALRQRKVRLGPVLVFLPALGKPASVRLRALLWNIWHDKPLPAAAPPDGVTSISVAGKDIDPIYSRAIGYPVYGPRAIRVDMLDRLIGAIYDNADKGVFKAKHEMAEWLGCPIPDLYAVLEAMDHKKIHDPADEAKPEGEPAAAEAVVEAPAAPAAEAAPVAEAAAEQAGEQKPAAPQVKPELATFRLRRGKAYGQPPARERPKRPHKPEGAQKPDRPHKPRREKVKRPQPKGERPERVISAMPQKKAENSPFAMLKDLKVKGNE